MYASIRKYKSSDVAETVKRVHEGFVPIISKAPGFVAYYVVDGGGGSLASVSLFETQGGAEESNRMAADWVKANLASLMAGPPEITAGEVEVSKTR
jgi:hypothetical protein